MNILYAVHHPLDPRLGTPAASMAVAREISKLGHTVEFYGYDQAFGKVKRDSSALRFAFPWKLASFLAQNAGRFDVLDITTGDAYLWAALSRVGARRRPNIITRSNGLEHLAHDALMQWVGTGNAKVSWRYPIYNGGLRLWEVKQSFRLADGAVVLNEVERRFAVERLGARPETTRVVPHGLDDYMLDLAPPALRDGRANNAARLCFVGVWGDHRGTSDVVATVNLLRRRGREVSLLIAGAGQAEGDVIAQFPRDSRSSVRVVPRYDRPDLPRLLANSDMLIFPSRFEGFNLAIVESMACGVIPIATSVGAAPDVIHPGVNGFLVAPNQPAQIADIVDSLVSDQARRQELRVAASASAKSYQWSATAMETLALYQAVRTASSGTPN